LNGAFGICEKKTKGLAEASKGKRKCNPSMVNLLFKIEISIIMFRYTLHSEWSLTNKPAAFPIYPFPTVFGEKTQLKKTGD